VIASPPPALREEAPIAPAMAAMFLAAACGTASSSKLNITVSGYLFQM
jgi:hypothetical protein